MAGVVHKRSWYTNVPKGEFGDLVGVTFVVCGEDSDTTTGRWNLVTCLACNELRTNRRVFARKALERLREKKRESRRQRHLHSEVSV